MAAGGTSARDLGAYLCFEDEAGQGLRPPRGHTWAPRGCPPTVRVRRSGTGRLTIAGLTCFRPGERPHFFFDLHLYRGRKGEPKSFSWQDYRDLLVRAHQQLSRPLVLVWDNLKCATRRDGIEWR